MKILFFDRDLLEARPLSRFRSIFTVRDGIYSPLERVRITAPDAELYYYHHDAEYEAIMAEREGMRAYRAVFPGVKPDQGELSAKFDRVHDSRDHSPFALLDRIGERIVEDLGLGDFSAARRSAPDGVQLVGDPNDLYLHATAEVLPGSVFDLRAGPIVIGARTQVTPFTYLEGPLYIGEDCHIDDARIGGGCILGHQVRAGGEIGNSIFGDFTNKHHEGFVGHSILGRWVNLGALTTTSDLKNNYGPVRLQIPTAFYPHGSSSLQTIDSGRIKFGSILGDCVKTAIGTMLNTGTVVDAGSNVFGGSPAKYLPPLSWGTGGELYKAERFLADCEKIFARRRETPHPLLRELVERMGRARRARLLQRRRSRKK